MIDEFEGKLSMYTPWLQNIETTQRSISATQQLQQLQSQQQPDTAAI